MLNASITCIWNLARQKPEIRVRKFRTDINSGTASNIATVDPVETEDGCGQNAGMLQGQ